MLQCLPEKIRPIVKPLMESIKKESNEMLQVNTYYNMFNKYVFNVNFIFSVGRLTIWLF